MIYRDDITEDSKMTGPPSALSAPHAQLWVWVLAYVSVVGLWTGCGGTSSDGPVDGATTMDAGWEDGATHTGGSGHALELGTGIESFEALAGSVNVYAGLQGGYHVFVSATLTPTEGTPAMIGPVQIRFEALHSTTGGTLGGFQGTRDFMASSGAHSQWIGELVPLTGFSSGQDGDVAILQLETTDATGTLRRDTAQVTLVLFP